MKFEEMKLAYGYPLQLQSTNSAGQTERFSSRLIGCLPGRSILLSVPKIAGKLARFRPGQKVVVRLMVDNGIGIFASIVETQTSEPYPILHISYPESVSFKGIRGATRVAIEEPVKLTNVADPSKSSPGVLVDISVTGARVEVAEIIGNLGDVLRISMSVNVAGIKRDLDVDAIIRSRVETDVEQAGAKAVAYGLEFMAQAEDKRLLLYAFVYAQIGSEEVIGDASRH